MTENPEWKEIARRSKAIREYLCLSEAEVSASSGVDTRVIVSIEAGVPVSDEELSLFAGGLRISLDYLIGRTSAVLPERNISYRAASSLSIEDKNEIALFSEYLGVRQ